MTQNNYIYLGDRFTDNRFKDQQCIAVRRRGKCIRGRNGNMLVSFNGTLCVVLGRRLRKLNKYDTIRQKTNQRIIQ